MRLPYNRKIPSLSPQGQAHGTFPPGMKNPQFSEIVYNRNIGDAHLGMCRICEQKCLRNHAGNRATTTLCSHHPKRLPSIGKHLLLRSPATVWQENSKILKRICSPPGSLIAIQDLNRPCSGSLRHRPMHIELTVEPQINKI